MTETRRHIIGFSAAALLLSAAQCDPAWGERASVTIRTVPPIVYTAVQQVRMDVFDESRAAPGVQGDLTWMFHLVFESHEPTELRIKEAKVAFTHDGSPLREETYSREYLEGMEWIRGAYRLTTDYFLDHVMFGGEEPTQPDLPPGGTISWVRIPFSQPSFALADQAEFTFELLDSSGNVKTMVHEVELHTREQYTDLRLPFDGTWLVVKGNHIRLGFRETGPRPRNLQRGWPGSRGPLLIRSPGAGGGRRPCGSRSQ
jgi:hypothetical protein